MATSHPRRRITLTARLSLYTLLIFLLLGPATAYFSLNYFQTHFEKNIMVNQHALVSHLATEIESKLTMSHRTLIEVARELSPAIVGDPSAADAFLAKRYGTRTLFDNGLFLFDPAGKLVAETFVKPPRRGLDVSYREYFQQTIARRQPYISAPYRSSQPDKHPSIMLTVPVFDGQGRLIAILGGSIDLMDQNFLGSLAEHKVGAHGYSYVVTRDRTLVVHPDRSRILTRFPEGKNLLLEKALQGFEGSGYTTSTTGVRQLASFKQLAKPGWVLATVVPEEEAFAPVNQAVIITWILVTLGGCVITVSFWLLTRRLFAPLLLLRDQLGTLQTGDMSSLRNLPLRNDEISDVAEAIGRYLSRIASQELEVAAERDRARLYLETVGVLVCALDRNGTITLINQSGCALLGYERDELLGRNWFELVVLNAADPSSPEQSACRSTFTEMFCESTDAPHCHEYAIQTRDGEVRMLAFQCRALRDEAGETSGVLFSANDITVRCNDEAAITELNKTLEGRIVERTAQLEEINARLSQEVQQRAQAQEEVTWLNNDLEERNLVLDGINRELESFCYSISHDLQAPLRHLNGFSAMLLEDCGPQLNEHGRHCLERIAAASLKMQGMIDDLLRLSRAGQVEVRLGAVNLSAMASEVLAMLQESEPDRQVAIQIADGLLTVGDLGLLRQVLQNLLGNAWKYTARQPSAKIEFGGSVHDSKQIFYVRDNGVGFDMAYAEKLFAPFQRFHGAEFAGNGIGLATVQRIIHRHGGTLWAEAVPDQGATFYFTLPN